MKQSNYETAVHYYHHHHSFACAALQPMKRVSKSQAEKNRAIAEIKRNLPKVCFICGQPCTGDAAHLLPKSIFPQYYTEPKNIVRMCRACHNLYDNDKDFRSGMLKIIIKVKGFAKSEEIFRYFGV